MKHTLLMTNLKNVLELIIVLQKSGWSQEQIIDFANTFQRVVQGKKY